MRTILVGLWLASLITLHDGRGNTHMVSQRQTWSIHQALHWCDRVGLAHPYTHKRVSIWMRGYFVRYVPTGLPSAGGMGALFSRKVPNAPLHLPTQNAPSVAVAWTGHGGNAWIRSQWIYLHGTF